MNEKGQLLHIDLLKEKNLVVNNQINDKYKKLYKNYKILLGKFLDTKFKLSKYDAILSKSEYNFIPVKDEEKDFYQYYSFNNLKYFYLRNDIFVEKLNDEDINKIIMCTSDELNNPNQELLDIIQRTYRSVLNSSIDNTHIYINCYGLDLIDYYAESDVIVFGVRFDEFANEENDENWFENRNKQYELLNEVLDEMKNYSRIIMPNEVKFIIYNEYNVLKNQNKFLSR